MSASIVIALLISPETKGIVFVCDLMKHEQQTQVTAKTLDPEVPTSI